MINRATVSYNIAEKAKENGFTLPTLDVYHKDSKNLYEFKDYYINHNNVDKYGQLRISAPTREDLQKWLRYEKDISVIIEHGYYDDDKLNSVFYVWQVVSNCSNVLDKKSGTQTSQELFINYEKAFDKGLEVALNML